MTYLLSRTGPIFWRDLATLKRTLATWSLDILRTTGSICLVVISWPHASDKAWDPENIQMQGINTDLNEKTKVKLKTLFPEKINPMTRVTSIVDSHWCRIEWSSCGGSWGRWPCPALWVQWCSGPTRLQTSPQASWGYRWLLRGWHTLRKHHSKH